LEDALRVAIAVIRHGKLHEEFSGDKEFKARRGFPQIVEHLQNVLKRVV